MADQEGAEWRQARREAAVTLQDALSWNLSAARWEQVREVIAKVEAAVSALAPDALCDATETLALHAPVRVQTRLGDQPDEPAPAIVREQIAELVDALQPHGSAGQAGSGLPSGHGQAARRGA